MLLGLQTLFCRGLQETKRRIFKDRSSIHGATDIPHPTSVHNSLNPGWEHTLETHRIQNKKRSLCPLPFQVSSSLSSARMWDRNETSQTEVNSKTSLDVRGFGVSPETVPAEWWKLSKFPFPGPASQRGGHKPTCWMHISIQLGQICFWNKKLNCLCRSKILCNPRWKP